MSETYAGRVTRFFAAGYGFVESPEYPNGIYFHVSALDGKPGTKWLAIDEQVRFTVGVRNGKPSVAKLQRLIEGGVE